MIKKALFISLLTIYSVISFAQTDSSVLIFDFEDGLSYQAKVEYDKPEKDPMTIALGIGTIGEFFEGKTAVCLELIKPVSPELSISTRFTQSFQMKEGELLNNLEIMGHQEIWSSIGKKQTRFKLFEAVADDNPKKYKPYFGSADFKVKNDVRIDVGLSAINSQLPLTFYNIDHPSTYITSTRFNYFNLVVGPRFTRTQNYKLSFQDSSERHSYQKLSLGVNLGYNLWTGSSPGFTAVTRDTSGASSEQIISEEETNLNKHKLGVGFDVKYTIYSERSGLFYSFDVLGRYNPTYFGDSVFPCPPNVFCIAVVNSDHVYGYRLMLLPRITVGMALDW